MNCKQTLMAVILAIASGGAQVSATYQGLPGVQGLPPSVSVSFK